MYLLTEGNWQPGYKDYSMYLDNDVEIEVKSWFLLGKVDKQYISYPVEWRIIYNYLMDVGIRAVFLKLLSRLREKNRNAKFYAIGAGVVTNTGKNSRNENETPVLFFAANHPQCVSRIVVPDPFVLKIDNTKLVDKNSSGVKFFSTNIFNGIENLEKYIGWSSFCGEELEEADLQKSLKQACSQLEKNLEKADFKHLEVRRTTEIQEQEPLRDSRLKAALFGLGNYAKVFIIPNLDKRISLFAVHEIDPSQIGLKNWGEAYTSTSPFPEPESRFDIYFAAGYHHTHAPIATSALSQNAYAVVEKPVATTQEQIDSITSLLSNGQGNLFACFHKRYSILNDWVLEDLKSEPGTAIDYHCIVYEIPLPERHWYNWKSSGSRIVSNGCHWIDHFMFLNGYSPAVKSYVHKAGRGQINIGVELENGAVFSMLLTDIGSPRLGVRDYIELRKGQTSIVMTDSSLYRSENAKGCIRKKSVNKIDAYRRMYATISSAIADGKPGDSIESLRSSELVITLDKLLASEINQ